MKIIEGSYAQSQLEQVAEKVLREQSAVCIKGEINYLKSTLKNYKELIKYKEEDLEALEKQLKGLKR